MRAITRLGPWPAGQAARGLHHPTSRRSGRRAGAAARRGRAHAGLAATAGAAAEYGQTRCALEALPARHREILQLVAVEALRYEVAAAGPEVPSGTVPSRSSRARSPLGFFLERHVAGEEQGGAGLAKGTGG
jgi:DNA-directed RNA polymerase specialized sigma24 family protein